MDQKKEKEHKKFMDAQAEEALKFKKQEDEKAGRDLGDEPIHRWIWEQSESFRKKWKKKS